MKKHLLFITLTLAATLATTAYAQTTIEQLATAKAAPVGEALPLFCLVAGVYGVTIFVRKKREKKKEKKDEK
jgi:hypothetical protein